MAAGQREPAEAWGAAGEPVEGQVGEVAQVGEVQLLQTRQSWPDLEQDKEVWPETGPVSSANTMTLKIYFVELVWNVTFIRCNTERMPSHPQDPIYHRQHPFSYQITTDMVNTKPGIRQSYLA